MKTDEIEARLKESLGKKVSVRMTNGDLATLLVEWVDQEGCNCRVFDHPDHDPEQKEWFAFDEIAGFDDEPDAKS